ncbi:citrate lyase acyl carrier protein [Intestinimonas massiliensis (ex Afouda et al. 2020)]|uniref:citrate lyase acyl carrier protein n=1 Tax=Intestinimonas massiliensis (ex Afouda et al. 2020) TaxID=1673721 RepID=UPI0010300318|nr:citrate lyase acyl carrier protein [Intestinimonas massiliensis (ex Afouda et al. 2020)]
MVIKSAAVAGTLESSDAQVSVEPGEGTLDISIQSSVLNQYGKQILHTVRDVLSNLEVTDAKVSVVDMGALDCTIRARVECAVFRSCQIDSGFPWGGALK